MRIENKNAVVTGAGRGLGRAYALALAEAGARVVVNDVDQEEAEKVVAEIQAAGGEAVSNGDSVATMAGGAAIVQTCLDAWGQIDILVNNAGVTRDRMVFNMTEEEWDTVMAIHLKGTFSCTRAAVWPMRNQGSGRIINVSSTSGLIGNPGQANYGAAKAGIASFTWITAKELAKYGITVNCVVPSARTRMTEAIPESRRRARPGRLPERGDPEEVASLVVFLASEEAAHINGKVFGAGFGVVSLYSDPRPLYTAYNPRRWTPDEIARVVEDQLWVPRPPEK